jgi:hypothetical protein
MAGRALRFPDRKISETFLLFAAPIIPDPPTEATENGVRSALEISFTVWNAVIFADVLNDDFHLDQVRRLATPQPQTALLVEQLIARKRSLFADDERLIGTWEIRRTSDGLNVRADARDPFSLPRSPTRYPA